MILAILQARMSSSRLPGKVLKKILGKEMLLHQIYRIQNSSLIDHLVVATSEQGDDDAIVKICQENDIDVFRGSLTNVLERFYRCCQHYEPVHIVRLTADCPLADWNIIDKMIKYHQDNGLDYTSNTIEPTYPDGLDVEVMSRLALSKTFKEAKKSSHKEHVTLYIRDNKDRFNIGSVTGSANASGLRWTVDEPEDLAFVKEIYEKLHPQNPDFLMDDILELLEKMPGLKMINSHLKRKSPRYKTSNAFLRRALASIPLASQTFSKSITAYPKGAAPLFMGKGDGAKVWDIDNNPYIDFVNALGSVTLGHGDEDIDQAIKEQMKKGINFTLPHKLECELAEMLIDIIPCAYKVRFAKNGTDVTSAAIRLARACTGREHIAVCGYHGWQDWSIGVTTKNLGVPKSVQQLSHSFCYNDIDSLKAIFSKCDLAAVILEPMNVEYPQDNFLKKVRELTKKNNTILVFDEIVTGFRLSLGGAQELFNVKPDLATFGKGMANGMPLSAIVGNEQVMAVMEDIFFSGTFGGETLSLAAAKATVIKYEKHHVIDHFYRLGKRIISGLEKIIDECQAKEIFSLSGNPAWSFLRIKSHGGYTDWEIRTFFLQELFKRGILSLGTHNLSYAHDERDIETLLQVYSEVVPTVVSAVGNQTLLEELSCRPIKALFRPR